MGAIDLVVQIEAPPSVASGLQRIGRGGHQVDAVSDGRDLSEVPRRPGRLRRGREGDARRRGRSHALPAQPARRPRAADRRDGRRWTTWDVDELFATIRTRGAVRRAEPRRLRRRARHALGPLPVRRVRRAAAARHLGSRRRHRRGARGRASASRSSTAARFPIAASTACSSSAPARARRGSASSTKRWSSKAASGETFVLGASSWRIEEITHDRVLVSPAPGEPGKMPFWNGDRAGPAARARPRHRPADARPAARCRAPPRIERLDARARSRRAGRRESPAVSARPEGGDARRARCDRTIVIERVRDELGDWRVCVLSPRGGRIHAPWAMAAAAKIREETRHRRRDAVGRRRVRGAVSRTSIEPPDPRCCCRIRTKSQALVVRQLGATALFAAKFRENAARSLLLPKRRPGHARAALAAAQARRRSAGGRVALRIVSRPARDLPRVPARRLRHAGARRDARATSAAASMRVVDGRFREAVAVCRVAALQLRRELPLRRRRAAGRAPRAGARRRPERSCASCSATPSCASCSTRDAMDAVERSCSASTRRTAPRAPTASTTCCSRIGDLAEDELARARDHRRTVADGVATLVAAAARRRRARSPASRASSPSRTRRATATRSACRCRRASRRRCSSRSRDPLGDLALRYARTHAPFTAARCRGALRLGAAGGRGRARRASRPTAGSLEGEFRPGGTRARVDATPACCARCAAGRSRSCATRSSRSSQPVLGRFATTWQGVVTRRHGADALLDVDRAAAGRAAAGVDPRNRNPAGARRRLRPGRPRRARGGRRSRLGRRRAARRARRPRRAVPRRPPARGCCRRRTGAPASRDDAREAADPRRASRAHGASFFGRCTRRPAAAIPARPSTRLWDLVWQGSSPTTRSTRCARSRSAHAPRRAAARTRRARAVPLAPAGAAVGGRPLDAASAIAAPRSRQAAPQPRGPPRWRSSCSRATAWSRARPWRPKRSPGGFGVVYPVLKAMEEAGRVRRGYFVAGLGATQFALPGALDLLRSLRDRRLPDDAWKSSCWPPPIPPIRTARRFDWPAFAGTSAPAAGAAGPGPDADGRRDGHPRRRCARRVSRARRSAAR